MLIYRIRNQDGLYMADRQAQYWNNRGRVYNCFRDIYKEVWRLARAFTWTFVNANKDHPIYYQDRYMKIIGNREQIKFSIPAYWNVEETNINTLEKKEYSARDVLVQGYSILGD